MNFDFQQQEQGLSIKINVPRFEASNVSDFRAALEEFCPDTLLNVEVEMNDVEMIDSSGVGALLSVHKKIAPGGDLIHLKNAQPAVLSVIEMLRLHRVFNVQAAA